MRLHRALERPAQTHLLAAWLATDPQIGRIVALEGNGRLTSFALFPERLPEAIEVFCAIAEGLYHWGLY